MAEVFFVCTALMPNYLTDRPISPLIEVHLAQPNTKTTQNGPFIFGLFVSAALRLREIVAPPEGEMPKIKGPFWEVLVFGRAKKWTSNKGEMGQLSARKLGLKAVQTRKTPAIFLNHDQRI